MASGPIRLSPRDGARASPTLRGGAQQQQQPYEHDDESGDDSSYEDDEDEDDYFVWPAQVASTTPRAGPPTPAAIEDEFRAAIRAVHALFSRKVISCENPRARAMMAEEPMVRLVKRFTRMEFLGVRTIADYHALPVKPLLLQDVAGHSAYWRLFDLPATRREDIQRLVPAGRRAAYNGVSKHSKVRDNQHRREAAQPQPKLLHHAAAKQADDELSIAAVPLPPAKTFEKHFVEEYGAELAGGLNAEELLRLWKFCLEGAMTAFGRTYRGDPAYNAVLNEFLGRPAEGSIGLNGNNAIPGSGAKVRRGVRDVEVDRRALVDGIASGGMGLPLGVDHGVKGERVSLFFPSWFVDEVSLTNRWRLDLTPEMREKLGHLPLATSATLTVERRQGPRPTTMGTFPVIRLMSEYDFFISIPGYPTIRLEYLRSRPASIEATKILSVFIEHLDLSTLLAVPFGAFDAALLDGPRPPNDDFERVAQRDSLLMFTCRRGVSPPAAGSKNQSWTAGMYPDRTILVPPPPKDKFKKGAELDVVLGVKPALQVGEYDRPCYAYVLRSDSSLPAPSDFADFDISIMPVMQRALNDCALVFGRVKARLDPLLVAKVSMRKRLDLLRAGKWQIPAIAKDHWLFPVPCGNSRIKPPAGILKAAVKDGRLCVKIDGEKDEVWWATLDGKKRVQHKTKSAKKLAGMWRVEDEKERARKKNGDGEVDDEGEEDDRVGVDGDCGAGSLDEEDDEIDDEDGGAGPEPGPSTKRAAPKLAQSPAAFATPSASSSSGPSKLKLPTKDNYVASSSTRAALADMAAMDAAWKERAPSTMEPPPRSASTLMSSSARGARSPLLDDLDVLAKNLIPAGGSASSSSATPSTSKTENKQRGIILPEKKASTLPGSFSSTAKPFAPGGSRAEASKSGGSRSEAIILTDSSDEDGEAARAQKRARGDN